MKIYTTSIDDILDWLNVNYDSSLPDPHTISDRMFYRAVLPKHPPWIGKNGPEIPEMVNQEKELFVKKEVMFEGRQIIFWEKQR